MERVLKVNDGSWGVVDALFGLCRLQVASQIEFEEVVLRVGCAKWMILGLSLKFYAPPANPGLAGQILNGPCPPHLSATDHNKQLCVIATQAPPGLSCDTPNCPRNIATRLRVVSALPCPCDASASPRMYQS